MEIKPLYRFLREDGGATESPEKPGGADYTTRYRLIASDGKLLTDGTTETYCIDVDSADGWSEIDDPETDIREDWREEIVRRSEALNTYDAGYTQEALEAMTNAELERILGEMGVSANMTKANMVTLILALQGGSEVELV